MTTPPAPKLFASLGDGRIYWSDDAGGTWRPMELRGDPLSRAQALASAA